MVQKDSIILKTCNKNSQSKIKVLFTGSKHRCDFLQQIVEILRQNKPLDSQLLGEVASFLVLTAWTYFVEN